MTHIEDEQLGIEDKSERREVTALAIKIELRTYARRKWPLENDKSRKDMLQRALDLTARRMKSFWEGEETAVPRGSETARIENLIGHKIGAAAEEGNDGLTAGQAKYRLLEARIAALEELFAAGDEEFGRGHLDGYRAFALGQGKAPEGRGEGNGPDAHEAVAVGAEHREG